MSDPTYACATACAILHELWQPVPHGDPILQLKQTLERITSSERWQAIPNAPDDQPSTKRVFQEAHDMLQQRPDGNDDSLLDKLSAMLRNIKAWDQAEWAEAGAEAAANRWASLRAALLSRTHAATRCGSCERAICADGHVCAVHGCACQLEVFCCRACQQESRWWHRPSCDEARGVSLDGVHALWF